MIKHVIKLCDPLKPTGCPTVSVDTNAPSDKQVVIEDDFGGKVTMAPQQFSELVRRAKLGDLDAIK